MKLYKYTSGFDEYLGVATDARDAYNKRTQIHPMFEFVPVDIQEIRVDGYEISVTPIITDKLDTMDADQLRAWLDQNNVEYHHKTGEAKLRELCKNTQKERMNEQCQLAL